MSRINSISIEQNYPKTNRGNSNFASKQNFGSGFSDLPEASKKEITDIVLNSVTPKVDKSLGSLRRLYEYLAPRKGEIQTQLITALFTTTLAPFIIAYNPFSDKPKEDKEYLAWRQPLSAVIALTGGLGMTIGLNSYLDTLYNEGHNKAIDLRTAPTKDYLVRSFKKINNIKNPFLNKDEKQRLEKFVKEAQEARVQTFTKLFSHDPKDIIIDETTGIIKSKSKGEIIGEKIPNLTTKAELEEYLNKNNLHNRTLGDVLRDEFKFEFYKDGKIKPYAANSKLSTTKAMDFLYTIGFIEKDKVDDTKLKAAILDIRHEKPKNAQTLANLLGVNKEKAKKILDLFAIDNSRNIEMTVGEEIGKAPAITLGQLFHQLEHKQKDGTLQALLDQPLPKVLDSLNKTFKGKLEGFEAKADLEYFTKNIIKNMNAKLGSNAINHKFYIGILTNLVTTAISCTVLNWAYPRFMETFLPHLVKSNKKPIEKKMEGGSK